MGYEVACPKRDVSWNEAVSVARVLPCVGSTEPTAVHPDGSTARPVAHRPAPSRIHHKWVGALAFRAAPPSGRATADS
ncbi:hypothetical protein GCM10010331_24480 [Streptomyces xanthochromogenes]|nr:hypothetical protein GCM10010331_24480 [Streptomyces xanthochromogenes]